MTTRQDAWKEEDDLILSQIVLAHIRNGNTQLAAFEEVAEKLNRTSAACGFRWNSEVRKRYEIEIAEAKQYRKLGKKIPKKISQPMVSISNAASNVDEHMPITHYSEQIIQSA